MNKSELSACYLIKVSANYSRYFIDDQSPQAVMTLLPPRLQLYQIQEKQFLYANPLNQLQHQRHYILLILTLFNLLSITKNIFVFLKQKLQLLKFLLKESCCIVI